MGSTVLLHAHYSDEYVYDVYIHTHEKICTHAPEAVHRPKIRGGEVFSNVVGII